MGNSSSSEEKKAASTVPAQPQTQKAAPGQTQKAAPAPAQPQPQKTPTNYTLPDEPQDQPDNEVNQKIVEYLSSSTDEEKKEKADELVQMIVEKYNINLSETQQRNQMIKSNKILQETNFDNLVDDIKNDKYKTPMMEKYPRLYKTFKYLALSRPGKMIGKKVLDKAKQYSQDQVDSYNNGANKTMASPKRIVNKVTLKELKEMANKYNVSGIGTKRQIAAIILAEKGHYKTVISKKDRKKLNSIL